MWPDLATAGHSPRRIRLFLLGAVSVLVAVVLAVLFVVGAGDGAPAGRLVAVPSASPDPAGADGVGAERPGHAGASPGGVDPDGVWPEESTDAGVQTPITRADSGAREIESRLVGMRPALVRYSFDSPPGGTMVDTAGRYALRQVVASGGAVSLTRRGAGYALRFPVRCRLAPAHCPRAILESTRADLFNPGTRPIRYGATVLMTTADTGPGANVVQKGFSVGGGTQFKLQIDGRAGKPSCVLANGGTIYRLISSTGVADGRWHNIACVRVGGQMAISVDGVAISRRVPATLSIRNSEPLRIGGKGAGPGNDQFAGRIDEVFVAVY